jgi:hypothetical protein
VIAPEAGQDRRRAQFRSFRLGSEGRCDWGINPHFKFELISTLPLVSRISSTHVGSPHLMLCW